MKPIRVEFQRESIRIKQNKTTPFTSWMKKHQNQDIELTTPQKSSAVYESDRELQKTVSLNEVKSQAFREESKAYQDTVLQKRRYEFMSEVIPLLKKHENEPFTRAGFQKYLYLIKNKLAYSEEQANEIRIALFHLSECPEYDCINPCSKTLAKDILDHINQQLAIVDLVSSCDQTALHFEIIHAIRRSHFKKIESFFGKMKIQIYNPLWIRRLFDKRMWQALSLNYFRIKDKYDSPSLNSSHENKTQLHQAYKRNILLAKLEKLKSNGIELGEAVIIGTNAHNQIRPTNFNTSELKAYLKHQLSPQHIHICEETRLKFTNDETNFSHYLEFIDPKILSDFGQKLFDSATQPSFFSSEKKSKKKLIYLRLNNSLVKKKLMTLIPKIGNTEQIHLKTGKNYLILFQSKNIVSIVIKKPKQWVYLEYDVYSFKQLKRQSKKSIFSNESITKLFPKNNCFNLKVNNSNIMTLFKSTKYRCSKLERMMRRKLQGIAWKSYKNLSIYPSVRVFYDEILNIFAVYQSGSYLITILDGRKFKVLDEVADWSELSNISLF